MKQIKVLASLALAFVLCSAFTPGGDKKGMYMAGVSASFTDSLIYFTDIQLVDSVQLGKDKLLPLRSQYSAQLENYLEQKHGLSERTSFIYFDKNKAKLEKTIKKMKAKYLKDGKSQLLETGADFKFTKATEY